LGKRVIGPDVVLSRAGPRPAALQHLAAQPASYTLAPVLGARWRRAAHDDGQGTAVVKDRARHKGARCCDCQLAGRHEHASWRAWSGQQPAVSRMAGAKVQEEAYVSPAAAASGRRQVGLDAAGRRMNDEWEAQPPHQPAGQPARAPTYLPGSDAATRARRAWRAAAAGHRRLPPTAHSPAPAAAAAGRRQGPSPLPARPRTSGGVGGG
jgi:hypothetical protein